MSSSSLWTSNLILFPRRYSPRIMALRSSSFKPEHYVCLKTTGHASCLYYSEQSASARLAAQTKFWCDLQPKIPESTEILNYSLLLRMLRCLVLARSIALRSRVALLMSRSRHKVICSVSEPVINARRVIAKCYIMYRGKVCFAKRHVGTRRSLQIQCSLHCAFLTCVWAVTRPFRFE